MSALACCDQLLVRILTIRISFRDYLEATGDTYALDFWTDTEHCNRLLSELRASSLAVTGMLMATYLDISAHFSFHAGIYLSQDSRERSDVVAQEVIDGAAVVVQKIGSIDISFENAQGQLLRSMYHNQFQASPSSNHIMICSDGFSTGIR